MGANCGKNTDASKEDEYDMLVRATRQNTKPDEYTFKIAKVIGVYDGDTYTIAAFHRGQQVEFKVRLYGVNCAELKGGTDDEKKQGIAARDFVRSKILNKIVNIEVLNKKEKYGRLLANITLTDGVDLADLLLTKGYAKEYYGGAK